MCVTSAVFDYFGQRRDLFPPLNPLISPPLPMQPAWTRDSFEEFKEIIRRLDVLDQKLGQPDCEDPAKAEWMREVEERLSRLESTAARPESTPGSGG